MQLKVILYMLQLCRELKFAEQKLMVLFVSLAERTFSQEKTAQEEERTGNTNKKHWTAVNGTKIRFYFYIELPLKDGGGIWRGGIF